ncbi:phosphoribosylformylglycinamidine synthase subunit PurS [Aminomonas paucivorans]|uniref:phosphoribosylformylglycinamidine synthase subunit PurS n=1 Tax=Aminomonas paucivorans TaxID=81412 RepID=UPI003316D838
MNFRASVLVYPKRGVLDTQGKAVQATLIRLGHGTLEEVRVGRYLQLLLEAPSEAAAREEGDRMCRELLVNDLIEEYSLQVEPA